MIFAFVGVCVAVAVGLATEHYADKFNRREAYAFFGGALVATLIFAVAWSLS